MTQNPWRLNHNAHLIKVGDKVTSHLEILEIDVVRTVTAVVLDIGCESGIYIQTEPWFLSKRIGKIVDSKWFWPVVDTGVEVVESEEAKP